MRFARVGDCHPEPSGAEGRRGGGPRIWRALGRAHPPAQRRTSDQLLATSDPGQRHRALRAPPLRPYPIHDNSAWARRGVQLNAQIREPCCSSPKKAILPNQLPRFVRAGGCHPEPSGAEGRWGGGRRIWRASGPRTHPSREPYQRLATRACPRSKRRGPAPPLARAAGEGPGVRAIRPVASVIPACGPRSLRPGGGGGRWWGPRARRPATPPPPAR
jgi:hypothetical protein